MTKEWELSQTRKLRLELPHNEDHILAGTSATLNIRVFTLQLTIYQSCGCYWSQLSISYKSRNMINAVLVFNNNGQPRLTKFYTQLVNDSITPPSHIYITPTNPLT